MDATLFVEFWAMIMMALAGGVAAVVMSGIAWVAYRIFSKAETNAVQGSVLDKETLAEVLKAVKSENKQ